MPPGATTSTVAVTPTRSLMSWARVVPVVTPNVSGRQEMLENLLNRYVETA